MADSQAGYTALSIGALRRLDLDSLYRRYGFPNDMLVHLNVQNAKVRDVPSRPIYGVGERSGIRITRVAPRIAWLLFKGFWWRMKEKYVIRDFHPLVFFYTLGALMTLVGFLLGLLVTILRIGWGNDITTPTIVLVALLLVSGTQFTLFAMWFDQEANKDCAETARRPVVRRSAERWATHAEHPGQPPCHAHPRRRGLLALRARQPRVGSSWWQPSRWGTSRIFPDELIYMDAASAGADGERPSVRGESTATVPSTRCSSRRSSLSAATARPLSTSRSS